MLVLLIALWVGFALTVLCLAWWCIRCYFSAWTATIVTVTLLIVSVVITNNWLNQPSEQELKTFKEKRNRIGQP